jgi:protocatechuate 3,4-dioxygenase beta subunit
VRQRVSWATLAFVFVTLLAIWFVAARARSGRAGPPPSRGVEGRGEATALPGPAPGAADAVSVPETSCHPAARRLRLRVVTAEGPLPEAEVRIDDEGVAVTGADGVAELETQDVDVVFVTASREGFCEVETAMPGGVDEAEILLVRGVPLRGQVVRASDGAPVAGAEVHAAERSSGSDLCRMLTADEHGRFTVPGVAAGTLFVVGARFEGFGPASTTGVAGSDATEVRVVLGDGATVEGTVRDSDGKAALGVAIRVFPADDNYLARSHDSALMGQNRLRAAARSTTDAKGSYAIEGIVPGEHVVFARSAAGASARTTFSVATQGESVRIDLTLAPTGCISVRVVDPIGQPVPQARLAFKDIAGKDYFWPTVPHQTDGRGEALAACLDPGTYEVVVQTDRWTAVRAQVVVQRDPPADVEIRVGRGVALEGTVRDPTGRPVAGIDIAFQSAGDSVNPPQYKSVVTRRDGRFVLEGLLPVRGALQADDWAERWSTWTTADALPGGPPLSIVVRRTSSVSGRFEPLPASLRVAYTVVTGDTMSRGWSLDLDPGGRFELHGVDEGEPFTVCFDVPGACLVRCPVAPLAPGERRDLGTMVVAPGRVLRGHAADQHGKPWAFTRIELGYDDYGIDEYTLTDGNGRFSFENIDPAESISITVWNAENTGQPFDFEDWTSEPVHELVVERPSGR